VLTVLGVAGGLLSRIAWRLINVNAGYIVYLTMVGHPLLYETFHFCCHCHENAFFRNAPFVNTIRRYHLSHHNQGIMMHKNMNLTFPIADWVISTSDLNRGLIGHLFNGFDESHGKPELKPIGTRFRNGETQTQRLTLGGPMLTPEEGRALA